MDINVLIVTWISIYC